MKTTEDTQDVTYAEYLIQNQNSLLSYLLQTPYRLHLKALRPGKTLDIGCGAGRNLKALPAGSMGIDHNIHLVDACKRHGLTTFTTETFLKQSASYLQGFDSILISHVAEHMTYAQFVSLLKEYFVFLKPQGRFIVICPQEMGYSTDSTHVEFMNFEKLTRAMREASLQVKKSYSFPFFRFVGKFFRNNEFIVIGTRA